MSLVALCGKPVSAGSGDCAICLQTRLASKRMSGQCTKSTVVRSAISMLPTAHTLIRSMRWKHAEGWRPQTDLSNANETRDNVGFLKKVVAQYYQTARDAILRYDANHLFVGDKINANTDTLDTVLPITSQFTDIIFYQMYAQYEVQKPGLDRWSKMVDKPIINGDSAYTMITDNMPRPYGPVADNLEQRAEWTDEFFRKAFARPEFVGWHYCGLIDAPALIARKQDRQHSGLMDRYGEPYPYLKETIEACTAEMYEIALHGH